MTPNTQSARTMFLTNLAHYMTALVVFLKGIDKVALPGKTGFGIILIVVSLIIFFGTIFHHRAEKYLKHFKAWVFVLEAIVMSIVGYLYLKDGKQMIQYLCFASAIIFIVATFIYFRKAKSSPQVNH
jgi:FtsH-binding integral membrane protein